MQAREHTAHTTNIIPKVYSGFPRLTKGEAIPPKANETAPNKADALPEYCLPLSIAKAVDEVKQNPNEKRIPSINTSYVQKPQSLNKAIISHREKTSSPIPPVNVPFSTRLNLPARAADMTTARAFIPKQILN